MKLLACGPIWCMSVLFAVDASSWAPFVASPQLIQGGALAVLGWTVYYVLAKVFPSHARDMKEQRESFLSSLESDRVSRLEFQKFCKELLKKN